MSVDRLAELGITADEPQADEHKVLFHDDGPKDRRNSQGKPPQPETKENPELAEHMKVYENIQRSLEIIQRNVGEVEKLQAKDRTIASDKARKGA